MDIAIKVQDRIFACCCEDSRIYSLYLDFCIIVSLTGLQSRIKPYFDSREQLRDMHNELAELINAEKNASMKMEWEKKAGELQMEKMGV